MPTFKDYLTSPAWWTSGLILAIIGGVLTIFVIRIFRTASVRAIRYLTARSEWRNRIFLSKVAHVSSSPLRFTLLATRQSSFEAVVPIYQALALLFAFLSNILPPNIQAGAAFIGFLFMLGGIGGQFHANYLFSILMAALEKIESSNPYVGSQAPMRDLG